MQAWTIRNSTRAPGCPCRFDPGPDFRVEESQAIQIHLVTVAAMMCRSRPYARNHPQHADASGLRDCRPAPRLALACIQANTAPVHLILHDHPPKDKALFHDLQPKLLGKWWNKPGHRHRNATAIRPRPDFGCRTCCQADRACRRRAVNFNSGWRATSCTSAPASCSSAAKSIADAPRDHDNIPPLTHLGQRGESYATRIAEKDLRGYWGRIRSG